MANTPYGVITAADLAAVTPEIEEVFDNSTAPDRMFRGRVTRQRKPRKSIQERFEEFNQEHPEVLDLMTQIAYQEKAKGHSKYSCHLILLRVKWDFLLLHGKRTDFSNDFSSRYARRIMELNAGLDGFFTIHELETA
jgi:hypothetical protein